MLPYFSALDALTVTDCPLCTLMQPTLLVVFCFLYLVRPCSVIEMIKQMNPPSLEMSQGLLRKEEKGQLQFYSGLLKKNG